MEEPLFLESFREGHRRETWGIVSQHCQTFFVESNRFRTWIHKFAISENEIFGNELDVGPLQQRHTRGGFADTTETADDDATMGAVER